MELKAVSARYEVATQLAGYKEELWNRGTGNILMWLVAPQVPHPVREFLDRIGIEYSEIHIAEFHSVAERRNVPIRVEAPAFPQQVSKVKLPGSPGRMKKHPQKGILLKSRDFIRSAIHKLADEQRNWTTRDQILEQLIEQDWAIERLGAAGISEIGERRKRAGNWIDWFSAEYARGKILPEGRIRTRQSRR